jgi:hypothetical protein
MQECLEAGRLMPDDGRLKTHGRRNITKARKKENTEMEKKDKNVYRMCRYLYRARKSMKSFL